MRLVKRDRLLELRRPDGGADLGRVDPGVPQQGPHFFQVPPLAEHLHGQAGAPIFAPYTLDRRHTFLPVIAIRTFPIPRFPQGDQNREVSGVNGAPCGASTAST